MVVDCHMLPAGVSLEFLRGDLRIVHKAVPKRETLMALAGRACKKVHRDIHSTALVRCFRVN